MAASLVLGQTSFTTGVGSTTPNGLSAPHGIAFDKNGNLWVADSNNNRAVEFTPPFSNGMTFSLVLGQTDLKFNCIATASRLCYPSDLIFDTNNNLWVVDDDNNRVLEFKPPFVTGQSAAVVLGQADFTSRGQAVASATGLFIPWSAAVDSAGNVWISDGGNWRVLEFTAPFSNGQAASVVLGFQNFTATINSDPQSNMNNPRGLTFDSDGNLFLTDLGGSRVLVFAPPFSNGMRASKAIGQQNLNNVGATSTPTSSGLSKPLAVSIAN